MRIIVFWGLYGDSPMFGNCDMSYEAQDRGLGFKVR